MKAAFVALGVTAIAGMAWLTFVPQTASSLLIENATAQPVGKMIGVELKINNQGLPDRLLSVSSSSGPTMFLYPTTNKELPIPVGQSSLAVDAAHIMLSTETTELTEGTLFPLTLTFEMAGDVAIKARLTDTEVGSHAEHNMPLMDMEGPPPEIAIAAVADARGWQINVTLANFAFSQEQVDSAHMPGVGHGHIYAGGMKLGRLFEPTFRIGALPSGTHEIRVTLNTNDHRAYMLGDTPISATTLITVD